MRAALFVTALVAAARAQQPTVTIFNGEIVGYTEDAFFKNGNIATYLHDTLNVSTPTSQIYDGDFAKVDIYKGIPYAEPYGRFEQARMLKEQWTAPFDATTPGKACPQHQFNDAFMSEYCLTVDVYNPQTPAAGKPVLVWIHGGGYVEGSALTYDGSFLAASEGKIVVVIQYRLGFLGFFSPNVDSIEPNLGLWDQRMALHWVQHEIKNFGGDADNVHILGESAGGDSVIRQLNYDAFRRNGIDTPGALGYNPWFHHATAMSPPANYARSHWEQELHLEMLHDFLKSVPDYQYTEAVRDNEKLAEYIRNAEIDTILAIQYELGNGANGEMIGPSDDMLLLWPSVSSVGAVMDNKFIHGYGAVVSHLTEKMTANTYDPTQDMLKSLSGDGYDLTGYNVTYAALNGDGGVILTGASEFISKLDPADPLKDMIFKDEVGNLFFKIMQDKTKKCYEDAVKMHALGLQNVDETVKSCKKAISDYVLTVYKSGDWNMEGLIKSLATMNEVSADFVKTWVGTVSDIKKLQYEPYVHEYKDGVSVEEQQQLVYFTHKYFTFNAVWEHIKALRNGARAAHMELAYGVEMDNSFVLGWMPNAADLKAAGYSLHANDIYYLFGMNVCPYTEYTVSCNVEVVTGDLPGAGTDANIMLILDMSHGETGVEIPLAFFTRTSANANILERGATDTFTFDVPDPTTYYDFIEKMQIVSDFSGTDPDWFVESLTLTCKTPYAPQGVVERFEFNQWINSTTSPITQANIVHENEDLVAQFDGKPCSTHLTVPKSQTSDRDVEMTIQLIDFWIRNRVLRENSEVGSSYRSGPHAHTSYYGPLCELYWTCIGETLHHFYESNWELETNIIPGIYASLESTIPSSNNCADLDDAFQQWQAALALWQSDHEKWQVSFQNYHDEL